MKSSTAIVLLTILISASLYFCAYVLSAFLNIFCFRHRFAWGEDALGPNVPVGGKMGAQENPELHTYDGVYRGSPEKGDKLIPECVNTL